MQRIFSALGRALRKSVLILCLMSLMSLSGLFLVGNQPGYAAPNFGKSPIPPETATPSYANNQATANRVEAYEEALEDAQNLQSIEKTYEENLEEYREEHPAPGLLEKVESAIENVTGNE